MALQSKCRRLLGAGVLVLTLLAAAAILSAPAWAASGDPNIITPQPPPPSSGPPPPPKPPPNSYLNGPCGLAVDSSGNVYVADYYHGVVDAFTSGLGYSSQLE